MQHVFLIRNATDRLCAATWSNYLLDVLVVVGLFVFMLVCAKRGFITCFFGFVSSIASFFIAVLLARGFTALTGGLFGLEGVFQESFTDFFRDFDGFNVNLSGADAETALSQASLPSILGSLVLKLYAGETFADGTTLASAVGSALATVAVVIISAILLYIACRLAFRLLRGMFNGVAEKLTLIGKVNSVLGALVGLIEGLFFLCAVLAILTIVPSEGLLEYLNDSLIIGALYNNNPLLGFVALLI